MESVICELNEIPRLNPNFSNMVLNVKVEDTDTFNLLVKVNNLKRLSLNKLYINGVILLTDDSRKLL